MSVFQPKLYPMLRVLSFILFCFTIINLETTAQVKYPGPDPADQPVNQLSNETMPVIGVWVWNQRDLEPNGYKRIIDQASQQSPYNLLVPFLRFPEKEVVDQEIYEQVKAAAEYARENQIGLLPDLDVRSARRAFMERHPDELQEMLRIKEIDLTHSGDTEVSVTSIRNMSDHYSGGRIPDYDALASQLLRVYAYNSGPEGIDPASLKNITADCELIYSAQDSVQVNIPRSATQGASKAAVMVSFTLFYPDVFAPHLLEFQRAILQQYADVPLAGACKDEWGFPPYFPRYGSEGFVDFWYSKHREKAYRERTERRSLLEDFLLMAKGIKGKEAERQLAINHFEEMSLHRNTAIENDFYAAVKELFGPDAAVTVHATWWPYPDRQEMKKNGLVWWAAKRDWAQTDEITPFAVRTALSKKWGSPLWYNMYYTMRLEDQVWASALAGGRINYLGLQTLFDEEIMRAETRIRLLNYISETPLDCQTAVIFGHAAAKNWAGPYFNDVGMDLIDTLWRTGYPADLIPTSEIENGSLKIDEEGWITYGPQRYSAVVLYQPEFEKPSTAAFFKKASEGPTELIRIGRWTKDFNGDSVDGDALFPEDMVEVADYEKAFDRVLQVLEERNVFRQTPATGVLDSSYFTLRHFSETSYFPGRKGISRLIDGTHILTSALEKVSGDRIDTTLLVNDVRVTIDAVGALGIRLDEDGQLEALAASELGFLQCGELTIDLKNRMDLALWKNSEGEWEGVVQTESGTKIPDELLEITTNWTQTLLPLPPVVQEN